MTTDSITSLLIAPCTFFFNFKMWTGSGREVERKGSTSTGHLYPAFFSILNFRISRRYYITKLKILSGPRWLFIQTQPILYVSNIYILIFRVMEAGHWFAKIVATMSWPASCHGASVVAVKTCLESMWRSLLSLAGLTRSSVSTICRESLDIILACCDVFISVHN